MLSSSFLLPLFFFLFCRFAFFFSRRIIFFSFLRSLFCFLRIFLLSLRNTFRCPLNDWAIAFILIRNSLSSMLCALYSFNKRIKSFSFFIPHFQFALLSHS